MAYVAWLNKLLGGCGVEREKTEAQTLASQIADAYAAGEINDDELTAMVNELCTGIVNLASQCNKPITQEECVNSMVSAIKASITVSALSTKIRSMLRKKREQRTETGILPS